MGEKCKERTNDNPLSEGRKEGHNVTQACPQSENPPAKDLRESNRVRTPTVNKSGKRQRVKITCRQRPDMPRHMRRQVVDSGRAKEDTNQNYASQTKPRGPTSQDPSY